MDISCSGVILAGGLSTRFSGKNKALIQIDGKSIIERLLDIFHELFHEIILVTNQPDEYLKWDIAIVTDIFTVRSSLTGIHAGLFYSRSPYAFITACDTPFLKKELIELLISYIESDKDLIIPETSVGFEPLCAIYSTRCLHKIEQQISRESYKIRDFYSKIRVKKIHEFQLRQKDPELVSFFNINTPEDLQKANHMRLREVA